jgi:ABC-type sugar transport system ATPase subunit
VTDGIFHSGRATEKDHGAPVLTMQGISKSYAQVRVLQRVDLTLGAHQVHALLGENGAGKSTLMKVLFGIVSLDEGQIHLDGVGAVTIENPRHALALGIGLVSQELSLVPQLDIARNIFLGHASALRLIPRQRDRAAAGAILRSLAPHLHPDMRVGALGMADRQLVEIARTLARGGRVIAFDEPTSSLTPSERDRLFQVIADLRARGNAIIYISHKMEEIRAVADRFTVLRDGKVVKSGAVADFTDSALNDMIAGRQLAIAMSERPRPPAVETTPILELRGLTTARVKDIDLALRPGEILGLAGLVGSGRSAILRTIFGLDAQLAGEIRVQDAAVAIGSPAAAMALGVALIPEDRRGHAIVPMMSMEQNFGLANHRRFSWWGILRLKTRQAEAHRYVHNLHIRPATIAATMLNLSGGNQQKVVIARWLATGARILLFDEPTRGIDVGAKAEIYDLLQDLAAQGAAIIVVSSELPELLRLSHRIAVVNKGRITRMLVNDDTLIEHDLMHFASQSLSA